MGPRMAQGSILGCESHGSTSGDVQGLSPLTHHLSGQVEGDRTQAPPFGEEFSFIQFKAERPQPSHVLCPSRAPS